MDISRGQAKAQPTEQEISLTARRRRAGMVRLINTWLQPGDRAKVDYGNRFNGFGNMGFRNEAVETAHDAFNVSDHLAEARCE